MRKLLLLFSCLLFSVFTINSLQATTMRLVEVWIPVEGYETEPAIGLARVVVLTNFATPEVNIGLTVRPHKVNKWPENIQEDDDINLASRYQFKLDYQFYTEGEWKCYINLDVSSMEQTAANLQDNADKIRLIEVTIEALEKNLVQVHDVPCKFNLLGMDKLAALKGEIAKDSIIHRTALGVKK